MITQLLKNRAFQIIISILLGLGLASLFRQVCNNNNCIIIKSPPKEEIENKVFGFEDKCYTYTAKSSSCKA